MGLEYFLKSVSHRTSMINYLDLFLTSSLQLCPFKPGVLGLPYCQRLPLRSSLLIEFFFLYRVMWDWLNGWASRNHILHCIVHHDLHFEMILGLNTNSSMRSCNSTVLGISLSTIPIHQVRLCHIEKNAIYIILATYKPDTK